MATASVPLPIGEGVLRWASSRILSRDKKRNVLGTFFFFPSPCSEGPGSRHIYNGKPIRRKEVWTELSARSWEKRPALSEVCMLCGQPWGFVLREVGRGRLDFLGGGGTAGSGRK